LLLWIDFDPLLKPVEKRGFGVDDKLSGVRLQRAKHPGRLVETKPCGYYSILFGLFKWQILKNGVKVKILYRGVFLFLGLSLTALLPAAAWYFVFIVCYFCPPRGKK